MMQKKERMNNMSIFDENRRICNKCGQRHHDWMECETPAKKLEDTIRKAQERITHHTREQWKKEFREDLKEQARNIVQNSIAEYIKNADMQLLFQSITAAKNLVNAANNLIEKTEP